MSMPLARISEELQGLRAAVFEGPGRLVVKDCAIPRPGPGEVLVRVSACGICGSDLNIFHRAPPVPRFWAGHEISGVVEETGRNVSGIRTGARVCVSPLIHCGRCAACSAGRENLCKEGSFISCDSPGGFAGFVTVPASNVFELPGDLGLDDAVLVEPLAAAIHAVGMGGPVAGKRALVMGAGTLGLLITGVLSIIGASQVTVLGRYGFQRELALEMGANKAVESLFSPGHGTGGHDDGPAENEDDGKPFDIVFDTTGGFGGSAITEAIDALVPGGVLVLSGVHYRTPEMNLKDLTEKEIEVRGAQRYRREDFVRALGLFAGRRLETGRLITHRVSLEKIMDGFSLAFEKKTSRAVKVIVCP